MNELDNKTDTAYKRNATRDFEELERRRRSAARMFASGALQADVARFLGVSRQSVSRWYRTWKLGGEEALKAAEHAGRNPKITDHDIERLDSVLRKGATAIGFDSDTWTLGRVAEVINALTGVSYHPGHIWRILKGRVGWSVTRATTPSTEGPPRRLKTWVSKS